MPDSPCDAGTVDLTAERKRAPAVALFIGALVTVLVVPTLTVTTARVLPSSDSLLWVILRSGTPLAIIPYTTAALILIGTIWGLRGAGRSVAVPALMVVTVLLGLHVRWFATPFLDGSPGMPSSDTVTVMTANLHIGRADPDAVVDAVTRYDVDVLVLEEITPSALADLDERGLDRRLEQRVGAPRLGRDGLMVFAHAPLRSVREIATASPGYEVEVTTDRGPLRILAVHPTAPNNGVAQWRKDLDVVVATARAATGPALVAGDFNATVDHPPLQALMAANYRDASADVGLGWRPTWPSPDQVRIAGVGLPSLFALDHVFIRGPLVATRAHTAAVAGTDHRALVTRIAWTDK